MSNIATLLAIFACLTTAFALNPTLTKNFFFVSIDNQLSNKLIHTTNGIIAYNLENVNRVPISQYLLLDPVEGNATPILEDLLSSCGHIGGAVFDRLHYHVQTSTLAYFCTANNSLLILDEKNYAVKNSISTGISQDFSEAKLTEDGSSLFVLLTGSLYSTNQTASQLVQFDLGSRKVIRTVVFDQGLETDEYVNGFVSQNNEAYALTNLVTFDLGASVINIYSVSFTDNTYQLNKIVDFTNTGNYGFLSQFYQIGDYLATNNVETLIIFDKQGKTVLTETIGYKVPIVQTVSYFPAFVAHEGSSDLYALLWNETLYKFSAETGNVVSEEIRTAFDFQVAYGNHYTSDLLFTIDTDQANFTIATLQSSELVYSMSAYYNDFMITNSTFAVLQLGNLQVFDRQTNALIGNVAIPTLFYLHKDTDTLYFGQPNPGHSSCTIKQLDLTTLAITDVQQYIGSQLCSESISQFKISGSSNPEFVALSLNNMFTIVTETHGNVAFSVAEFTNDLEFIVPDFDTMSVYRLQSIENATAVSYYEYTGGNGFTLKNSYDIAGPAVSNYYASGNDKVIAFSDGSFRVIDLEYGSSTEYSYPTATKAVSSFQDNAGRKHLIFSDNRINSNWYGTVTPPSLYDSNGVSPLPGTNNFTVQAGAAGPCSYWIVDGFVSSVGLVKFYDACAQEDTSMFSILQ